MKNTLREALLLAHISAHDLARLTKGELLYLLDIIDDRDELPDVADDDDDDSPDARKEAIIRLIKRTKGENKER